MISRYVKWRHIDGVETDDKVDEDITLGLRDAVEEC